MRRRRAFAMGIAAGAMCVLVLMSGTLGFTSSGASRAVVRELGDHACLDLARSALAEALVTLSDANRSGEAVAGLVVRDALRRQFPFADASLPTPEAHRLAKRLHPELTLGQVTVRAGARSAPGQEDPLCGTVELAVQAAGRVCGVACGLEVVQRIPFRVRCVQFTQRGRRGAYLRFHWGEAWLSIAPLATVVKPL